MYQTALSAIAPILTTSLILTTFNPNPVQALPVTYDFTVTVTAGSLAGNTFQGSFSYDDEKITGVGKETLGVAEGLTVNMNFLGINYTPENDVNYPNFPQLTFDDGAIEKLDFWIEPGQRIVWWNLPGWKIELSPRISD